MIDADIERYMLVERNSMVAMERAFVGQWVRFSDHKAALARLTINQARELAAKDAQDAEWSARVGVLKVSIKALEMQVATANARIAELEGALRFYADEENYKSFAVTDPCGCCSSWYEPKIHIDGEDSGDKARAALKEQPE